MLPDRELIDPTPTPETEAFWQASAESRFVLKRCRACERVHWYPRTYCPFCSSGETEWFEASGRGTIYSCAYMWRAKQPYLAAYVTLQEGPTLLSNIVDCEPETVRIGDAVELAFKRSPLGFMVPMFRPAAIDRGIPATAARPVRATALP